MSSAWKIAEQHDAGAIGGKQHAVRAVAVEQTAVGEAKVPAGRARSHAEARYSRGAPVKALHCSEPEEVTEERLIETIHVGGGRCDAARRIHPRRMRRRRERNAD